MLAASLGPRDLRVEQLNTTLVCIIGSLRGGTLAHSSLVQNVLQPLRADLALLLAFGARPTHYGTSLLLTHAKHVWRVPEALGWNALLDEVTPGWRSGAVVRDNVWGGVVVERGASPLPGSGAIIFVLRQVLLGYLDALRGHRYRQLIVTRSDHWFGCPHPRLPVHADHVHLPEGEAYGGVTDRHAVFAFASRARVLGVLPWLVRHDNATVLTSVERVIAAFFASSNLSVKHFARPMVRWTVP